MGSPVNPLIQILAQLGMSGGNALANALEAQGSPIAYQQMQEAARQKQQQDFLTQQRSTLSAGEQAQLAQSNQFHKDSMAQAQAAAARQAQMDQLNAMLGIHSGALQTAPEGSPGSLTISNPVEGQPDLTVGPRPFNPNEGKINYRPTPEEKAANPWIPDEGIWMPPAEFAGFHKDILNSVKLSPQTQAAFEKGLFDQVNSLVDPSDTLRPVYGYLIHDAIMRGDTKAAVGVLDDIRKQKEVIATETRKQLAQYGPEAIRGAGALAEARTLGEQRAREKFINENGDAAFPAIYQQIHEGKLDLRTAFSGRDSQREREAFLKWASDNNAMLPTPLSNSAQTALASLQPVRQRVQNMLNTINDEIKKNPSAANQAGYFTPDRIAYGFGIDTRNSGVISAAELDNIVGATRILKGGSRAWEAISQAKVHLPNFWKDSPQLMRDKLEGVRDQLDRAIHETYDYGNRYGISPTEDQDKLNAIGAPQVQPIYKMNPSTKQRIVSRDNGQTWFDRDTGKVVQ
jgi:hypothetical protein